MGKRHLAEDRPRVGTHQGSRFFFICPLRFQHRNQFAGNKGECYKNRCQHNARHRKHHMDPQIMQQRINHALSAECQQEDQTGNDRRNGHRHIDQRSQHFLAAELILGDFQCCKHAEYRVHTYGNGSGFQRQQYSFYRVFIGDSCLIGFPPVPQCLGNDSRQRQEQHDNQKQHADTDQNPLDDFRTNGFFMHAHCPPFRIFELLDCTRLVRNRIRNAATSITNAMEVALV